MSRQSHLRPMPPVGLWSSTKGGSDFGRRVRFNEVASFSVDSVVALSYSSASIMTTMSIEEGEPSLQMYVSRVCGQGLR